MKRIGKRLSYANVAATIALFLALGGGAYAATQLPKNSIGSRQIKKGSIQVSDLSRAARKHLRGTTGDTGATGPQGPAGPTTTNLPSGQTLRGVFNIDDVAGAKEQIAGGSISFGMTLPKAPLVEIVKPTDPPSANCPGSLKAPTAGPGVLCVYEEITSNVSALAVCALECEPDTPSASPFGAELYSHAINPGRFSADGSWAVTAP
jgi:hypothetical protein